MLQVWQNYGKDRAINENNGQNSDLHLHFSLYKDLCLGIRLVSDQPLFFKINNSVFWGNCATVIV
jgi:hypothetical protein